MDEKFLQVHSFLQKCPERVGLLFQLSDIKKKIKIVKLEG